MHSRSENAPSIFGNARSGIVRCRIRWPLFNALKPSGKFLSHGGHQRAYRHCVRWNRVSRPPYGSPSPSAWVWRTDRIKTSGRGHRLFALDDPQLQSVKADIHDERSVADAIAGAYGVVNAVSLYVEQGQETFHSVHVESAQRLAAHARRAGVERLVHVSGIGADPASPSLYIRKRGEGELAVQAGFADATIIRPAVMFGPDDAFLTTIFNLLRWLPIYPMFGRGLTKLQPAYVEDVAEAIATALQRTDTQAITFECGGPRFYTYEELLRTVARGAGLKPRLIPVPFAAWHALGLVCGNATKPARDAESSGADAGRQCVVAGDARIWRTWNFTALASRKYSRRCYGIIDHRASPASPLQNGAGRGRRAPLLAHLRERQANGLIVTGSETDVCVLAAVLDAVDFWLPCNCGAERHLQFLGRITRRKSIPERFINAAFAVLYGLQLLFFDSSGSEHLPGALVH